MVQRQKKSKVRWYFAIAFFIIGFAYMDRSNISFIAPQMMEDLSHDKATIWFISFILLTGLCIDASPFRYVSREVWSA